MGFYLNQKDYLQIPVFLQFRLQRPTGRSTGSEVGRPSRSTDVHGRARLDWQVVGRPVRSTGPESSALWKVRPTVPVDRQRVHSLLQLLGRPGRSTGGSNGRIFDRWRSTGRSTGSSDRLQRLVFWQPINWGSCHCLKLRFWRLLEPVFSYSFQRFFSTKIVS